MAGIPASRWLGMRCAEPGFQAWLKHAHPEQWAGALGRIDTERAASVVRAVCSVESRAEIDKDPRANNAFHTLIREPWINHQGVTR